LELAKAVELVEVGNLEAENLEVDLADDVLTSAPPTQVEGPQ
jgi:hypothetical protein